MSVQGLHASGWRARLAVMPVIMSLTLAGATFAVASDAGNLDVTISGQSSDSVELSVAGVDPSVDPTRLAARVWVDGVEVPARMAPVVPAQDVRDQSVMMVLDASGSMSGERLRAAKDAAQRYVNELPSNVKAGLILVSARPRLVVEPKLDRQELSRGIEDIEAQGSTALFDAIAMALAATDANTRLLVLSDGQDTDSSTTIADLQDEVASSGTPVDIIAIEPDQEHRTELKAISGSSTGQVVSVDSATDLASAFQEASTVFDAPISLTVAMPSGGSSETQDITVEITGPGYRATGSATLPAMRPVQSVVLPTIELPNSWWWLPWIVGGLAAGCVLVVTGAILVLRRRRMVLDRLGEIDRYHVPVPAELRPAESAATRVVPAAAVSSRNARVSRMLQAAALPWQPRQWLAIRISVSVLFVAVIGLITRSPLVALAIGGVVGWLATGAWLSAKARRKREEFAQQLPDLLRILASGMRAGLSFPLAMQSAAGGESGEMGRQLERVLAEVQVGVPTEDALRHCAERMDNRDLEWTVVALGVQQETGGNLSSILDGVAKTLQGRAELQREVRALSAEGRLSAYILGALPIAIFLFIYAFRREYLAELTSRPMGILLLGLAGLAMVLGGFWMRSIVRSPV